MPRYTPQVAKAKSKKLIKDYQKSGLNQHRLAKELGCSQSNVSQMLSKEPVKETMSEILDRVGLTDDNLAEGLQEGREAMARDMFGKEVGPNHSLRHKFIVTALEVKGHVKHNGQGTGNVSISAIVFNVKHPEKIFAKKELNAADSPKE